MSPKQNLNCNESFGKLCLNKNVHYFNMLVWSIRFSKFMSLSPIIRVILWGKETSNLKIQYLKADRQSLQFSKVDIFVETHFTCVKDKIRNIPEMKLLIKLGKCTINLKTYFLLLTSCKPFLHMSLHLHTWSLGHSFPQENQQNIAASPKRVKVLIKKYKLFITYC